ncbi:mechanosensitive ion channel [bacterium]|nr:mechanosensitive ion channel [bacterium]
MRYIRPVTIKKHRFILMLLVALVLFFAGSVWAANVPGVAKSQGSDAEIQIPENMTPEKVDAYMAGMSDEQARQALADKLKQEAATDSSPGDTGDIERGDDSAGHRFHDLTLGASLVLDQIASFFSNEQEGAVKWDAVVNRLSGSQGIGHLLLTVVIGLGIIVCGIVIERLVRRLTGNFREQILTSVTLGRLQQFGRFISRFLLNALGIVAYIFATFILLILIFRQEDPGYWIVSPLLITSYYVLVIMFAARIIMSPASPALRLLPMQDRDAKFLYRWIVGISIVAALFITIGDIFRSAGRSEALFNLFFIASGLSVSILMIAMIWRSRHRVAEAICADTAEGVCDESSLRTKFARTWHYFAILYVAGSGTFWLINVFMGSKGRIINLIAGLFLIPIFIGLDQWVQRLLKIASGELPEVIDLSGEEQPPTIEEPLEEKKTNIKHFAPLIRRLFRIALGTTLFFIVLGLWGIDFSIGRIFAADALKTIMVLILGFVIWEFVKSRIDRKLQEEMPEDDEEKEEGGAGGSRIGTLLMLLRKFVMAVMFVMVSLIVLSNLGVNIGPLIAGAGVIGLAIGFGAQTLVKDIIAGIFFLIDDAFRVGDYIETAGTKGMVDHISLRSLRLRHPRGPVFTIPFGSMGTVKNNSRDYIISKLDFRVRYDTDVDKVRKIIKKINKIIMKDEDMAPVMLGKLKSQGVRELDDSAMVMRVKFKTIPGEQFVVRREVFRMMQESFKENGIEFAHRNVTVYLPPEDQSQTSGEGQAGAAPAGQPDKKIQEAAAAAAAVIQAEEEAKQAALEAKKK